VKRTAHFAPAGGPQRQAPSRSVGSPTEGHLVGGAHLGDAPHLRVVPTYAGGDVRWGVEPLVGMIDRAARNVRKQFPDAVLSVGHLSKPGGGELDRHASHESGRDADIGFYVKNQASKPVYENSFVAFLGDGTAPSWPGARFDDARNWALVASFVNDPQAHVTHIFVATPLRARLLSYADKIGASPTTRNRAAELMAQPKGSLPHDDHFHVRIACPSGMDKCVEQPTARRHGRSHTAVASAHAHAAPAHRAQIAAGPAARSGAAPAPAPAKPASPARPAPASPASPASPDTQAKSEASMPSLAPEVPGLDAAVIAAPLSGLKAEPKPEAPKADPIDDPDGVLESH
jgi:penicillin-insensitive murein DD-endopeptidase